MKNVMEGKAVFPLPKGNGPAKGEGPMTLKATGVFSNGKLILDGYIKDGVLTFIPKSSLTTGVAQTSAGSVPLDNAGLMVGGNKPVKINVENGAKVVQNISHAPSKTTGTMTWTLKGEKIEKWKMTIIGWDTLYFGSLICGGIRVHWQIDANFEIKNNQYSKGSGTAKFRNFEPHSVPAGLFTCSVLSGSYTDQNGKKHKTPYINKESFNVSGKKSGNSVSLHLPNDNFFAVDYKCVLSEEGAKAAYEKNKAQYAAPTYKDWVDGIRKEAVDGGIVEFPGVQVLQACVQMPLKDGWSREFGSSQSIDYAKISLTKLK
ncbi:MAG: hypothetical protein JW774_10370 [Candidatus Aureabacteria bacterium]|nr:hypothetical protein [Candidatus Auribacterota bacterium]